VPEEDLPYLHQAGIQAVFGPGATTEAIAEFLRNAVAQSQGEA
jgi:methylmalonyl-CoA mutase cobalamin-binding subunit